MKASIDLLVDKLERQASACARSGAGARAATTARRLRDVRPVVPDEDEPVIVKTKQFAVKPMGPEEAVLQLELIGHDFFVFLNSETFEVNVVYRRRDRNYGLIEPQVP